MINNLRTALITILLFHFKQLSLDNCKDFFFVCQNSFKLRNKLNKLVKLVFNCFTLEAC
ncbi:hypothetical protein D3C85_1180270 [compost metagenome]